MEKDKKIFCSNCSRNKTVGYLYDGIYVCYCYHLNATVYSDTQKTECAGYTESQNK